MLAGFVDQEGEEFDAGGELFEREGRLLAGRKFQYLEDGEVAGDDELRQIVIGERIEVVQRLTRRLVEIATGRLLLDDQLARPEEVDEPLLAAQLLGGMLEESAAATAIDPVDIEELRLERLAVTLLIGMPSPA